jgi:hypothetical protein
MLILMSLVDDLALLFKLHRSECSRNIVHTLLIGMLIPTRHVDCPGILCKLRRGQTAVEWCICFRTTLPESMLFLAPCCSPKAPCSCERVSGNFVAGHTLSLTRKLYVSWNGRHANLIGWVRSLSALSVDKLEPCQLTPVRV